MPYLFTVDPGVATGIAFGHYGDDKAYKRIDVWIVKGGVTGFLKWFREELPMNPIAAEWVSESFILRDNDFIANTEPVKIEGAMEALELPVTYQSRTDKALCKDQVLKAHGLWVTGKMVNHTDGRDANDATIHALARMKKLRHTPSLKEYWS